MSSADSSSPAPRRYRSRLREEQALQTKSRILAAASSAFADKGYAGTSLSDIAAGAGVSVESVKVHGPKGRLLLSAFETAFGGAEGQRSLTESPDLQRIMQIPDDHAFLAEAVGFIAEANARTSGLWSAFVSAASGEPAVREALDGLSSRRKADYRAAAHLFYERGLVTGKRDAKQLNRLADSLSFLMSPESHEQLVTQAGWSFSRYRDWLVSAVTAALALEV
ncbi:regulatory protein, tetR family [Paramicrobacterium humi]|uniref:Regulatory protein, tetR family n=1 Tax=Paramicrobacterium humi TaxID=640635 RepID=A0A1H4IYQ8_9MICO|nr:TetR family transcriptional regulator [Microbacterium humi]SEB39203.1 regulatory protein, tetR family [Microbacterium humi]